MRKGIDISYHQRDVDFNKVKASGIDFVILREGYRKKVDKKFFEYVQKAKAAGLVILGVYHFSYPLNSEDPKKEARFCVENVKRAGLSNDTIIFYDFEYDSVQNASRKGVILQPMHCNAYTTFFCEEVKSLGFDTGIYTNLDYYKHWYQKDVLNSYKIWLADYSGKPDYDCLVQQYSSKGKVPGIKGNVDMNLYFGELANSTENTKDIDTIAREVISGLWGDGSDRKKRLEEAGFNYREVQNRVNEILNGPADNPISSFENAIKQKYARCYAQSYNPSLSGTYVATANLYCRDGAGTSKIALCRIPKGTKVNNYGYYTTVNGVKWLLIQFELNGIWYTGFSSSKYLTK